MLHVRKKNIFIQKHFCEYNKVMNLCYDCCSCPPLSNTRTDSLSLKKKKYVYTFYGKCIQCYYKL